MAQREDLNNKQLIENKFIEIKTDSRTGKRTVIHNYSTYSYLISTLEQTIEHLKNELNSKINQSLF
jgi:flagellar biosynthesis chaperone FliJ